MALLSFSTIPKQAPTLMEALTEALERVEDLERRTERVEAQVKAKVNNQFGVWGQYIGGYVKRHYEISDEYYGDGMRGEHNAE